MNSDVAMCVASREVQIKMAYSKLVGNISFLSETITELEKRLAPALRPEPECGTPEVKREASVMAPLAVDIAEQAMRIDVISNRLKTILDHLEI